MLLVNIRNKEEHSESTALTIKESSFLKPCFNCHNPISASMRYFGSSFYRYVFNSSTMPLPTGIIKVATCKAHALTFARLGP